MQVLRQKGKTSNSRSGSRRKHAKLLMETELLWCHDENALNYKLVEVQYKKLPCTFLKHSFLTKEMVQQATFSMTPISRTQIKRIISMVVNAFDPRF